MTENAISGGWERVVGMGAAKRFLARLWSDENGISSVEYALLLAFIASGIIVAADQLSNAVENEMTQTAGLFDDTCDNVGSGDGTGGAGDTGQGGQNTC